MSKLTPAMDRLLKKAPEDWGGLPAGVHCTNATLEALERRGLVETRLAAESWKGWEWRRAR